MRKKDTSWEEVSGWYDEHLKEADTYHEKVVRPNLIRMLGATSEEVILDLGCGQGFFTKEIAALAKRAVGADLSRSLIEKAREQVPQATFHVADAASLSFAKDGAFDAVTCVLALQNMEKLADTLKETRRVLKPQGRFLFVLNHPAFRIPKRSSWGWDDTEQVQYRRVDGYLSASKEKIMMRPGTDASYTWTFHRSLQDFTKALHASGFCITRLEEWISHRKSEKGPRMKAEDMARKEIPLFLAIEARTLMLS